jgi:periplasmic protein TonB
MPTSDVEIGKGPGNAPTPGKPAPVDEYRATLLEETSTLRSLIRGLRERLHEPKITVPKEYYRGEAKLPVTEMGAWYKGFGYQLKALWEKRDLSRLPESIRQGIKRNEKQEERRLLLATGAALLGGALGMLLGGFSGIGVGLPAGYVAGYLVATLVFPKVQVFRDIWQDYGMQPASWVNSLLVHALAITALILPYMMNLWIHPQKAKADTHVVDISPYLPDLPPSPKKAGGGGGGGDRSPTPASKGPIPKFSKEQLTPPVAVLQNLNPKMPAPPTLLGPPDLKLPQMQASITFGDPRGVAGPPSNGPGTGGGIGSGEGTGIGSGTGGGLGPGQGGGTGGGVYSVGGGVSAPIPIYQPEPPYSEEARKAKFQGVVVLSIVVDTQGNVSDVHVVRRLGLGLDEKAEDTVKTWKFKPAQRNGAPVPVRVMVEVSFRLF